MTDSLSQTWVQDGGATESRHASNPFMDPVTEQENAGDEADFSINSTLAVRRNASLTLATDSLIVLGMSQCWERSLQPLTDHR